MRRWPRKGEETPELKLQVIVGNSGPLQEQRGLSC